MVSFCNNEKWVCNESHWSEVNVQVNERLDVGESLRVNFTQTEEAVQICRDVRLRVVRLLRKEGAEE